MSEFNGFLSYVFDELGKYHPFFRYPYLSSFDFEPYVHQAEIYYKLLPREPIRFLIADDVGLGKTIEGIMIIDELIKRGARNILIVLPKNLVEQWKNDLNKFLREWNTRIVENPQENTIVVVSIDKLKRERNLKAFLDKHWDLILLDEIHKVSVLNSKETQRYTAIKRLVEKNINSHFIGLSATPHRGDENDFFRRLRLIDLNLVDPTRTNDASRALMARRTKYLVNKIYECDKIFPDAQFIHVIQPTTEDEKEYYSQRVKQLLTNFFSLLNSK
uniref:Helicase ATP-binding domain-containing protein n=1 Tax=Acidianus sulfidivorans JP7 TaxID=619593 RepID=A0A2U9IQ61_9CREN